MPSSTLPPLSYALSKQFDTRYILSNVEIIKCQTLFSHCHLLFGYFAHHSTVILVRTVKLKLFLISVLTVVEFGIGLYQFDFNDLSSWFAWENSRDDCVAVFLHWTVFVQQCSDDVLVGRSQGKKLRLSFLCLCLWIDHYSLPDAELHDKSNNAQKAFFYHASWLYNNHFIINYGFCSFWKFLQSSQHCWHDTDQQWSTC